MTVAVLILAICLPLLVAAWRHAISPEITLLSVASAIGLLGIDVVYVKRGTIGPIYLVDGALELILLIGWCVVLVHRLGTAKNTSGFVVRR
jgi:hypothetical protein